MLVEIQNNSTEKYVEIIFDLKLKFYSRFLDFQSNEKLFNLFSIIFLLTVEYVSKNMQLEHIDLQSNTILKEKYNNVELSIYYS